MTMQRFSPAGRVQADKMVTEMTEQGIQAKIGETWLDYGAGMLWETVLVYSKSLKLWYQSLTPADFAAMNAGSEPRNYRGIIESAKR